MSRLLSLLSRYTRRLPEHRHARRNPSRKCGAGKPIRRPLCLEPLEDRALPSVTVSISDASAVEGAAAIRYIDDFVTTNSGGLFNPHQVAFGPDGYLYVTSGFSDQVLRYD